MPVGALIPVFVQRDVEDSLAAGIAAEGWRGHANLLCYSFTWHQPYVGVLNGHVHTGLELSMVLSGEIDIYYDDATVTCGPGGLWLCGMWEPHAWRINQESTQSISLIFLPELLGDEIAEGPPYLAPFALPPSRRPQLTDRGQRDRVLSIGRDIYRESAEQRSFWKTAVRLDLLRLLTEISRVCDVATSFPGEPPADANHGSLARLLPALRMVHETPGRRVSVADAAAACALSVSRFGHLFRSTTGTSFGRFCLRVRLMLAAHHLLSTDHTVSAIAEEAGFVDVSHLARSFARYFGCTPTQYRVHREQAGSGPPPQAGPAGRKH